MVDKLAIHHNLSILEEISHEIAPDQSIYIGGGGEFVVTLNFNSQLVEDNIALEIKMGKSVNNVFFRKDNGHVRGSDHTDHLSLYDCVHVLQTHYD